MLEAAAKVFHERGYAAASIQDVADELGILKGSLYHYIDSKEDLLLRLLEVTHDDVDRILTEVEEIDNVSPLDRLRLYVHRQVEYNIASTANLQRVSIYYRDLDQLGDARRRLIDARRARHYDFVMGQVAGAQAAGLADATLDPVITGHNIFATISGTSRWYRPRAFQREAVAAACAAFAVRAVAPAAS